MADNFRRRHRSNNQSDYKTNKKVSNNKVSKIKNVPKEVKKQKEKKIKPKKIKQKMIKPKTKRVPAYLIVGLIIILSILFLIIIRYSQISSLNYKVIEMNNINQDLDNQIKTLKIELDSKSSSKAIQENAKEQGMVIRTQDKTEYVMVE